EVLEAIRTARPFALNPDTVLEAISELPQPHTLTELRAALSRVHELTLKADPLTRTLVRDGAIHLLKALKYSSPARLVDAALNDPNDDDKDEQQSCELFPETEPWPESVIGSDLLDELVAAQRRFLIADERVYWFVALWSVFTHVFESFDCLPLLLITAPS